MEATIETTTNAAETATATPAPAKRKKGLLATVTAEGTVLTFDFPGVAREAVDVATLPEPIQEQAKIHGINQKLRDSYAGSESASEAHGYFSKVLENLRAGDWSVKGEGEPAESIEVLIEAFLLARERAGKPAAPEAVRTAIGNADKDVKAKLRASLKKELAEVRASRAKPAEAEALDAILSV